MNEKKAPETEDNPRHFQMVMNILMVSVLLACFAYVVGATIHTVYPAWGPYWFPIITFLITFVIMITRYVRQVTFETQPNPIGFTLAEAFLIVLLAKVISVFSTVPLGWTAFLTEISSWEHNFVEGFFTVDFLLRTFSLMVIWVLTWIFSMPLNQLQEDEALMAQEKLGFTFNDRPQARRKLIALIFNLGMLMIIILLAWNRIAEALLGNPIQSANHAPVLIIYFFTGFIFLALNQYVIMKARWYFNDIKVSPDLAKRWLLFSLLFILLVIIVVILLPTGFTIEVPALVGRIADLFVLVFSFLYSIIIAPFVLIIYLIERYLNFSTSDEPILEVAPQIPEMVPQISSAMPWWDVVRSLLFWVVFIAVIIAAVSYYWTNQPSLKGFFSKLRFFARIRKLWAWLSQSFRRVQQATAETLHGGWEKINEFLQNQQIKTPAFFALAKRMPPRLAVIMIYVDWISWNQKHGLARQVAQTPLEYAHAYRQHLPNADELSESVTQLTEVFIQARYSKQPLLKAQVQEAQRWSRQLKLSASVQQDQQENRP